IRTVSNRIEARWRRTRRTQTSTIFAPGSKTRPQLAASSSPGLSGRPRRAASPFGQQEPQPVQSHRFSPMLALKAGSALSNPEDEIADTARQNVRFGAAYLTGSATSIGARN